MSHGIRRIAAVGEHVVEGFETGNGLVLAEGDQQIGKFVFRNVELLYCFRQRHKNRVAGIACVAGIELRLPFIEQGERCARVSNFVAEIVGDTAIGIHIQEILTQVFGEKPGGYGEIFVVGAGEAAAVFLRLFERGPNFRDRVFGGEAAPALGSGGSGLRFAGNRAHVKSIHRCRAKP